MGVIAQTKQWVNTVVIGHNFCPFARREVEAGRVEYQVATDSGRKQCLQALRKACKELLSSEGEGYIETSFLILPRGFEGFYPFLDFLDAANDLICADGFEGVIQLASFHPDYCFEGAPDDDAANYTNRSPYPMLHLIREQSLEEALGQFDQAELIPERNIAFARALGTPALAAQLKACLSLHNSD